MAQRDATISRIEWDCDYTKDVHKKTDQKSSNQTLKGVITKEGSWSREREKRTARDPAEGEHAMTASDSSSPVLVRGLQAVPFLRGGHESAYS